MPPFSGPSTERVGRPKRTRLLASSAKRTKNIDNYDSPEKSSRDSLRGKSSQEKRRNKPQPRWKQCEQMPTSSVETHWAMMVSEVLRGHSLVTAVHVGNRFMSVDRNGICGVDRGPGNHAVCVDGVRVLTDRPNSWSDFILDMPNSWGKGFGDNGRGFLTISHSQEPIKWHATYSVRSVTEDPNSTNPFVKG